VSHALQADRQTMRVLFVVPYVPSVIRTRPFGFIRALSALGHEVHVVALRPPEDAWAPVDGLASHCAGLEIFDLPRARTLLNVVRAIGGRLPLQAAYGWHARAHARVQALASPDRFDVVHIEHLRGVTLARGIRGVPVVLDAVDSISLLFAQTAQLAPSRRQRVMARLELPRTRALESRLPYDFDRLIVTSERDRDAFVELAGNAARARLSVVSNGVDVLPPAPALPRANPTVVFTGKMSYHANAAAAHRLATEIMPLVWQRKPDVRLVIAGRGPSAALQALARESRITVAGFVDELPRLLQSATVAVAPMTYAVGVQNKVLEAMAAGVAVVASDAAAAGIGAERDRDWLVASSPEGLAAAILRLLDDAALRGRIAQAGRRYVEHAHSWTAWARRLTEQYALARDGAHDRRVAASS
jgi:glycosyltransferase involved in cell wall biosynthesis